MTVKTYGTEVYPAKFWTQNRPGFLKMVLYIICMSTYRFYFFWVFALSPPPARRFCPFFLLERLQRHRRYNTRRARGSSDHRGESYRHRKLPKLALFSGVTFPNQKSLVVQLEPNQFLQINVVFKINVVRGFFSLCATRHHITHHCASTKSNVVHTLV